jgi:D-arabinose 1-dehydrogenase-like Zn-dependent alcohol dehydrogenase
MQAITVDPRHPGSARLDDVAEPDGCDGAVLVEAIAVGVCGTDVDIVEGKYGWAPAGCASSWGMNRSGGSWTPGDLVVGIVRRPDPVPCPNWGPRRYRRNMEHVRYSGHYAWDPFLP